MAWLCDICGIADPMSLAVVWPVVLGVVRVVALRFLAGAVLRSSAQCWVAVVLAVLCDSIGADYFSPQSVGFVVGVLAFGVALDGRIPTRVREAVLLLCGVTLAVSHQLSPFVVGGVLVVLVAAAPCASLVAARPRPRASGGLGRRALDLGQGVHDARLARERRQLRATSYGRCAGSRPAAGRAGRRSSRWCSA